MSTDVTIGEMRKWDVIDEMGRRGVVIGAWSHRFVRGWWVEHHVGWSCRMWR